jgi:hypothetical protein
MTARTTLAALALCMTAGANAQAIYRCGDAYSQTPCPQARLVDVADARSEAQLTEAKRQAANDRQRADDMASERLAARNAAIKAERKSGKSGKSAKAKALDAAPHAQGPQVGPRKATGKPAATKDFVAQVPGSRHKRGRA